MLKRILGMVGWLGVALVFAAVAIRFLKPEYQQYYNGLAIAGLVCTRRRPRAPTFAPATRSTR